ncbi:MAG: hypothetical protein LBK95_13235 [Bifidobacteriaceae bacterium]|jgi:hypothetical protein|nr:hypothetical protein [Bifidobacteriaceae bacterium]
MTPGFTVRGAATPAELAALAASLAAFTVPEPTTTHDAVRPSDAPAASSNWGRVPVGWTASLLPA